MPQVFKNQAIMASAGSGKTYQLAHRYIGLLASGVAPENIIALTFSRKAAGEIFDSIIKYLCDAANSPENAAAMGKEIAYPGLKVNDYRLLLRGLLNSMHRLHNGTLDSFTVGTLRAFPLELGIAADFEVMDGDGAEAKAIRTEIMSRIFGGTFFDKTAERDFFAAFKRANFGREEKGTVKLLDDFISNYRGYYLSLPERAKWGEIGTIWKDSASWLADEDIEAAAAKLMGLLAKDGLTGKMRQRWEAFTGGACAFCHGSAWPKELGYLFDKIAEARIDLTGGDATLRLDSKDWPLSAEECRLIMVIFNNILKAELVPAVERTRGIYGVLDAYEKAYNETARRTGKLTFTDVQYLLTRANQTSGGRLISREQAKKGCFYLDYRLDCSLDHWLLDEFQDTSDLQWDALSNLAKEILQDKSHTRSLFYVGDVKQAIYGWRGGNAELFQRIIDDNPGCIEKSPLSVSFRSCQDIIDGVNLVLDTLPDSVLPGPVITRWQKIWQEHGCGGENTAKPGSFMLLEPAYGDGDVKPTDEDRYHVVADLLSEIEPLKRNLSVAVLVRSNDTGKEVVSYLRENCPEMRVMHEGVTPLSGDPVSAVLLALVKFAAHPGDTLAWRHLQMSPLGDYIAKNGLTRDTLPLILLREISESGFQNFFRRWGKILASCTGLDGFAEKRLGQLAEAAAEYDNGGTRDADAFLRFITEYQLHETASENAVRVMTVHQSKGLGFDIVILPDLQGDNILKAKSDFIMGGDDATGKPAWVLKMPKREVAEAEPTLARALQKANEDECFDNLCLLYVALTRAKRGLYLITSDPGRNSQITSCASLIKFQLTGDTRPAAEDKETFNNSELACLYSHGNRDWYEDIPVKGDKPDVITPEIKLPEGFLGKIESISGRPVLPSEHGEAILTVSDIFANGHNIGAEFGSAVHELFAGVSWIGETDIDALIEKWQNGNDLTEVMKKDVLQHFQKAVASPEIKKALSRPEGNSTLWREKNFDIVLDGKWTSGVFDRVVIIRNKNGEILRVTVQDFKSDIIPDDAALAAKVKLYRSQVDAYRDAIVGILKVSKEKIAAELLLTGLGRVCQIN